MKILFLHGLDTELTADKRAVLSQFGEVIAPTIDYRADAHIIKTLEKQYSSSKIDVIIGSSMGGFAAYYLSLILDTPCLTFNPALPYRSVKQEVPSAVSERGKYLQVVLGIQDETIKSKDTMKFLREVLARDTHARVHIINQLAHRIPLEIFETEANLFFNMQ